MKKVLTDLNIDGKILAEGSSEFSLTNSEDNSVTIQELYNRSKNGAVIQQPDSRRNLTQITSNNGSDDDWTYTANTACSADMWVVATITGGNEHDLVLHRLVAKHSTESSDLGTVLNSRTVASAYGDSIWAYYRKGEYVQYFRTACSSPVTISYYVSPQTPIEPSTINDGSITFQLSGSNIGSFSANQDTSSTVNVDLSSNNATTTFTDESGDYSDKPLSSDNIQSGWSLGSLFARLKKWLGSLKKVAFSGSFNDLSDKEVGSAPVTFTSSTVSGNIASGETLAVMMKKINIALGMVNISNSDWTFTEYIRDSNLYGILNKTLGILMISGWFRVVNTDIPRYAKLFKLKGYSGYSCYPLFATEELTNGERYTLRTRTGESGYDGYFLFVNRTSTSNSIYFEGSPTVLVVEKD